MRIYGPDEVPSTRVPGLPLEQLLLEHRAFISRGSAQALTSPLFAGDEIALETFFSQLHECRNKSEHVHGLHPYPAKFIPHIPRALIQALARSGDIMLDPMCGSGTTLVEAAAAGHRAIGVDINPIATLVSQSKTRALTGGDRLELRNLARRFEVTANGLQGGEKLPLTAPPQFHNRDKWFEANVTQELGYAMETINRLTAGAARALALCAFSSIPVTVSNQESETRWCAKPNTLPDGATLRKLASKLTDSVARVAAYSRLEPAAVQIHTADARCLPLEDESVGLIGGLLPALRQLTRLLPLQQASHVLVGLRRRRRAGPRDRLPQPAL